MKIQKAAKSLATQPARIARASQRQAELLDQIDALYADFKEIQKLFVERRRLYEAALKKHEQIDRLLAETALIQEQNAPSRPSRSNPSTKSTRTTKSARDRAIAALSGLPTDVQRSVLANLSTNQKNN